MLYDLKSWEEKIHENVDWNYLEGMELLVVLIFFFIFFFFFQVSFISSRSDFFFNQHYVFLSKIKIILKIMS